MEFNISTDKISSKVTDAMHTAVDKFDDLIVKTSSLVGIKINDEGRGEQETNALRSVRRYSTISFFGGMIPVPFADLAVVTSAQLKMLQEIAEAYEVPFSQESVKIVLSSLLGSLVPQSLTTGIAGSAVKTIPVVGQLAGSLMMPALSSGISYALGKTFIQHFEAGGTLFDLDPAELKAYFQEHLDAHMGKTEEAKTSSSAKKAASTSDESA
jgi:uncharacterized protein (DUF697 family)